VHSGQDELLCRFRSVIAAAADALIVRPPEKEGALPEVTIAPLRRLQEQAERYLRVAKSPRARFWLFLLSVFLQDVFYNLSGDVPYAAESHACQQRFFVELARDLREFSSTIADEDAVQPLNVWQRIVSSYCETVTRINDILAQE
jgi:hypothetical protein